MVRKQWSVMAVGAVITITVLVALVVCESRGTAAVEEKPAPEAPWSVRYHDGNGNGYRFWKSAKKERARYEYAPIQPENSSSGIYSGGKPQKGTLAAKRVRELWRRVRKLEADASLHADSRMMGTGSFVLKETGSAERKFLIKGGSVLKEFDTFLEPLRNGSGKR
jgi:hypothetical protein